MRPPSPPRSKIPQPALTIPPEEANRHKASSETVLKHQKEALTANSTSWRVQRLGLYLRAWRACRLTLIC